MNSDLYFIDEAENDMGRCLVLKSPWSDDFINVIRKESISVLRLTESMGWRSNEISFLEKLKDVGLRGVEIYAWGVKDITPLSFLSGLEYLGLQCEFNKTPDFSNFEKLRICKLVWRPAAKSVFGCLNLQLLNIVNYPFEDLSNLNEIVGITRLQITSKKLVSLAGIESLQSLKVLDLAECPNLEYLTGIEKCQQLQVVEIENCKKITEVSNLGELANLRALTLTDCGKLKTLRPLVNCRSLENLTFGGDTNIEDGELDPLLNIPELKKMWFVDKRHYSHKRDQVATMLIRSSSQTP